MAYDQKYTTEGYAREPLPPAGRDFGYSSAIPAPEAPPDMSPFHLMGNACTDVGALVQRIHQLADRLTGSAPTAISDRLGDNGKTAQQPPIFHALRLTAEQMAGEVQGAQRALDRIERALP